MEQRQWHPFLLTAMLLEVCLKQVLSQVDGDSIEIQRHYEFEDILDENQNSYWVWRSEASELKTLRLEDMDGDHKIFFRLCVQPVNPNKNVTLKIANIRYSNDGPSDTCYVTVNGQFVSVFKTFEKWRSGHEWNVFRHTGQLGQSLSLPLGNHELAIKAKTDKWGVEFDRIIINAENQNFTSPIFCGGGLYDTGARFQGFL